MASTSGSIDLNTFKGLRDDVTQYFWFESNSSSAWGSGAHVTLYPESQFTDSTSPNYMKGQNIIMNTDGFSIRNGVLPMMVLDNDSLDFNTIDTINGTYTTVASFGATVRVGAIDNPNIQISGDSMMGLLNNGVESFNFDSDGGILSVYKYNTLLNYFYVDNIPTTEASSLSFTLSDLDNSINENIDIDARLFYGGHDVVIRKNFSFMIGSSETYSWEINVTQPQTIQAYMYFKYDGNKTINVYCSSNLSSTELEDCKVTASYNIEAPSPTYSFGYRNDLSGGYVFAQGSDNTVSGNFSHVTGANNTVSGNYAFVHGYDNICSTDYQTVIGKHNDRGNYAFIIGNGNEHESGGMIWIVESNALTVDWDGNTKMAGTLTMSDHNSPLGWYDNKGTGGTAINKLDGTSFASISASARTLSAGRWLIIANARYSGNANGYRGVAVYQSGTVISRSEVLVPAIPSASWATNLTTSVFVEISSSAEFMIGLLQNSGGSLPVNYDIYYIRIR